MKPILFKFVVNFRLKIHDVVPSPRPKKAPEEETSPEAEEAGGPATEGDDGEAAGEEGAGECLKYFK